MENDKLTSSLDEELRQKRVQENKAKLTQETDPDKILTHCYYLRYEGEDDFILATLKNHFDALYHYDAVMLIKFHIDILFDAGRYLEALEALDLYDEKPYVSQEVNELVRNLRLSTHNAMLPKREKPEVTAAYLAKNLQSTEPVQLYKTIQQILDNIDDNEIKALLTPILLNEEDDFLKHLVFNELFERAYDGTIEIIKFSKKYVIDFQKFLTEMADYTLRFNQMIDEFVESQKNVTIRVAMYSIAKLHALYLYPLKVKEEDFSFVLHNYYVRAANFYVKSVTLAEYAGQNNLDYAKLAALDEHYKIAEMYE